jgi:phospholipid-binding lipoprotein MlaA
MHRPSMASRAIARMSLAVALMAYAHNARAMTDPLESFNRAMFTLNDAVIDYVVTPVGQLAQGWLSPGTRLAASNIYTNLSEPEFIVTNLMQGRFSDARVSLERVVVNTTLGIGGVFDPATRMGLVGSQPEFSEAVCSLGVPAGPYLVVPLVGSANVGSAIALGSFMLSEIYLLSLVSTTLVAADVVIDTSVAAALLRHSVDAIGTTGKDPYQVQRAEYFQYIEDSCSQHQKPKPVG